MENVTRPPDHLRPIKITRRFTQTPAGSVLWEQGRTIILCTASIASEVPPWFPPDRPGGWITADYVMLPPATPQRKPWPKTGHTDSRGTEIQRLIGRSLRAAIDLSKIGPHTINIDCQVLQADGGTRTASICGAWVALAEAIQQLPVALPPPPAKLSAGTLPARFDPAFYDPAKALVEQLAAVSVGIIDGQPHLDLDYDLDSRAEVDLNVACTAAGRFVEVQGSAENGLGFDRKTFDTLVDLAVRGARELMATQRQALSS